MSYFGAIEAGGTKIVCCVGDHNGHILHYQRVDTRTPGETMAGIVGFFHRFDNLKALGVGAFGPVDLDPDSPTYGYVLHTPKLAWRYYNLLGALREALGLPVILDTDVNAAALGEYTWGAGQGVSDMMYMTVGTGIGVGYIANHQLVHGFGHPEMGHMPVKRSPYEKETFAGICPYHQDCLEGLASGTAINKRWRVSHCSLLDRQHLAWDLEADYLAQGLGTLVFMAAPKKIIMGGGVMNQQQLFRLIRRKLGDKLGGYITHPLVTENAADYIVPPALGNEAGIKGALALAASVAD